MNYYFCYIHSLETFFEQKIVPYFKSETPSKIYFIYYGGERLKIRCVHWVFPAAYININLNTVEKTIKIHSRKTYILNKSIKSRM